MLAAEPLVALAWIHAELGVAGEGHPADRPDLHGDLPRLGLIIGQALARVHSLNPEAAPLNRGWETIAAAIEERLEAGLIDSSQLGEAYGRYGPQDLVAIWRESRPATEDLVVCAGRPLMSQLLIADSELAGLMSGEFAIIADRHLDLAVAHQSVHVELGSEAVYSFYEGYGQDANMVSLDHYVLASRLLGLVP